ncbi:MAG TPA: peptidylprolyl isomerase [Haliangiales bacterium]|nr:peptidylprolyl isomerase [Haliangiales bacterium]
MLSACLAATAQADEVAFKQLSLAEATEGLPAKGKLMADITTSEGKITCELFPESAPKTVASFVGLARGLQPWKDPKTGKWVTSPFFDGLAFHRVIPEFMIQGGDPLSREYAGASVGTGGPGYTLPDEIDRTLQFNKPGRLAMANKGAGTNSGGSQFFITEGRPDGLDFGYAIFGQCDNQDVVKKIARVQRGPRDKPQKPVTMEVKIYKK